MHPKLSLFPLGDRHLCLFRRRRDERDPMKSPDMSVEMGNTGSVEIAFLFSRKKFIHVVGSFELAFRDSALPSHLFIPSQKRILCLNPPSHQEYRK